MKTSRTLPKVFTEEYLNLHGANGTLDKTSVLNFGRAMMIIAGADGEISPAEMAWLVDEARAIGTPEDIITELQNYDYRGGNLETCLDGIMGGEYRALAAKNLLYRAIRMAMADGYDEAERDMAAAAAQRLGVPAHMLALLEAHAHEWDLLERQLHALRATRRAILAI